MICEIYEVKKHTIPQILAKTYPEKKICHDVPESVSRVPSTYIFLLYLLCTILCSFLDSVLHILLLNFFFVSITYIIFWFFLCNVPFYLVNMYYPQPTK